MGNTHPVASSFFGGRPGFLVVQIQNAIPKLELEICWDIRSNASTLLSRTHANCLIIAYRVNLRKVFDSQVPCRIRCTSLGILQDWHLASINFKSAFTQGKLLKPIYLKLLPGYKNANPQIGDLVMKIMTSLYGDRRAANLWYAKI